MYWEAHPFIKRLNLKKDSSIHRFQVFKGDDVVLVITGVGKVKAAIAITFLFSKYEAKATDLLINVGICGGKEKNHRIGGIYLCNKIIDNETKMTYYPDILFKHPFEESSIETYSTVIETSSVQEDGSLVDMEASGIYQGASVFLQTHQICFIKIVSDFLNTEKIKEEKVIEIVETQASKIIDWMKEVSLSLPQEEGIFSKKDKKIIDNIVRNLKLSFTMEKQLEQMLAYYKLQHGDILDVISRYANVICKSKEEGKNYFAELKEKLI